MGPGYPVSGDGYHSADVSTASPSPAEWRSYWNERYLSEPSHYGDEPNRFVKAVAGEMAPGRALDAACGQGRNAVWLAARGHDVTGIDLSDVAIDQARGLAARRGVRVDFEVADILTWEPSGAGYDLVLLSYLQLPPGAREEAHRRAAACLAPGGRVLLVAHHRDNLESGLGGPQDPDVLFTERMLAADFAGLIQERNERVVRRVDSDDLVGDALDLLFVARLEPAE